MPQFNGKQEGMPANGVPNLRCPRNGKRTNFLKKFRFHHKKPLGASEQRAWEGDGNRPASPDTGQRGGCTPQKSVQP
jgi:hypothetical protein